MYERFDDRSRKVMQLANQEAQRFSHEYIGTEHILLALVKEGQGVAAKMLKDRDIDLRKIRLEVEKIIHAGPNMVITGKLPQTPRAVVAIEFAMQKSVSLNHNWIGTEHLLLGLLREREGVAAQVLMNLGVTIEQFRQDVIEFISPDPSVKSFAFGFHTIKLNEELLSSIRDKSGIVVSVEQLMDIFILAKDQSLRNIRQSVQNEFRSGEIRFIPVQHEPIHVIIPADKYSEIRILFSEKPSLGK